MNRPGLPDTHLHFCPSCGATWEHDDNGCDKLTQSPGIYCAKCDKTARQAASSEVMYLR